MHQHSALKLLEEAHQAIERTTERWFAAEVLRLQGQAPLQIGTLEKQPRARERFSDVLATARPQGARFWELRVAIGLAGVDSSQVAAREQVAVIYSSFTEGMALPDLMAAQTLSMAVGSA